MHRVLQPEIDLFIYDLSFRVDEHSLEHLVFMRYIFAPGLG